MSKDEKKQEHEGVCPNCGYCPHCGRANEAVKYVPYPVPQPYPVPAQPFPWTPRYPSPIWVIEQPARWGTFTSGGNVYLDATGTKS